MGDWLQMAVSTYFKRRVSLKKQFFIFGLLSLILSMVLSVVFLGITNTVILEPLKNLADIEGFVETNKKDVLSTNFKAQMDAEIKKYIKEKASYWVVLNDHGILYSASEENLNKEIKLENKLYSEKVVDKNTNEEYRIIYKPIILDGKLKGGFVLKCKNKLILNIRLALDLAEKNELDSITNLFMLIPSLLMPPIIVVLLISFMLFKNINEPLEKIISWSEKIKNNDLNFKVDSSYNNEFRYVMEAFEDMRAALESSLKTQWLMTKQRKDMILSLTHDIKTPITIICGHLELITGEYSNINEESKKKSLDIIMNNANRIKKLINELNEVWDLEKPDFLLNIQNINLLEFLNEVQDNFCYTCNEKKVRFDISHNFNKETCFKFDAFRIEEVLENLVSNSLRFTDEGGSITIECKLKKEELIFKIADTGRGFEEECINDIFERFYKGKSAENGNSNCGLGMYICKLIVDKHKGYIKAYNNDKGGAVVEFSCGA